jgi:hypothetical protein
MSEKELLLAKRHDALTEDGTLKNGYTIRSNFVGKEQDREVLQLVRTVRTETRYGKDVFHSGLMQFIVGTHFV